jgi:hypothetical protein
LAFQSIVEVAASQESLGKYWDSYFYKTGSPVLTAAGMCGDLSMAPGTPKYNAYVGSQLEGTPFIGSGNNGIYVPGVVGDQIHIQDIHIGTSGAAFAPATFWLCDYLYAYPLIDMDSTDVQLTDGSVAAVPRYANGDGVRAAFVTTTPQSASAQVNIAYTNAAGVANRAASFFTVASNVGWIQGAAAAGGAAGAQSPFLPLASGDSGMRSIQGLQCLASAGGFGALVLVLPLAEIRIREQNTPAEINFLVNKKTLPRVLPGAYLNFMFSSGVAAQSSAIRGFIRFIWG